MPAARAAPAANDDTPSPLSRAERLPGQPLSDATQGQRRLAALACLVLLAATALLLPFAGRAVGRIPAFLAMYQTAAIGTCLLTAWLLYAHFRAVGAVPLLLLGAGYVYTALVLAMQLASARGLFVEGAQLLGGPQSTVWLWLFWHLGPVLTVLHLARADNHRTVNAASRKAACVATAAALAGATAATAILVFGLFPALPVLDVAGDYRAITTTGLGPALQLLIAATLAVLWRSSRLRNVLHVWLALMLVALFCDNALTLLGGERTSLGWYGGRLVGLTGLSVLAVAYLSEIRAAYAQSVQLALRLASSNSQLDAQAQESRLRVEDLQRADVRKDEFLAMLAHELRNPLAPMQSAADLLSVAHANGEVVRKTAAMLTRQVRQMSGLVEDLLDASRLSRGRAELQEVPLDAKVVLSQSIEQVTGLVDEKGHTLAVRLPAEDLFLSGDHRRLVQVFTNLLVNAARYTPRGGRLEVQLEGTSDEVLVRVRDNGIGMSDELLARAFLLFAQGAPSANRPQGGLGIGLTLVKGLVELHRGSIEASSAGEGQGTEMLVRLPRLAARGGPEPLSAPRAASLTDASMRQ